MDSRPILRSVDASGGRRGRQLHFERLAKLIAMERLQLLLAAAIMLSAGGGMAAYEWSRIRTKRPLFGGSQVVTLYWCMYLSLIVLGFTTGIAAIVRG